MSTSVFLVSTLLLATLTLTESLSQPNPLSRRRWVSEASTAAVAFAGASSPALAIDLSSVKREGETEDQARLRAIKSAGTIDPESAEFIVLDSGVQYAEYKLGKGEDVVQMGKRVAVKCTGRLPALATKEAPGGLQFFNSKFTDVDELNWRLGDGSTVPGLEQGMVGMKKGGLRRIIVPDAYFTNKAGEKLRKGLAPQPNGERGQRWFDSVVNNPRRDQTVVYVFACPFIRQTRSHRRRPSEK
jgi:FKBP-type peptidyl-prolyl cis-trans isomerase